jgi:hypothetical protein
MPVPTATTWTNQYFNITEARIIDQAGHDDLPPTTSSSSSFPTATSPLPPSSPPPTGAIVGGVIGGLVIMASFIACCVWIIRRHMGRATHITARPNHLLGHTRKISDSTTPILQASSITSPPFYNYLAGHTTMGYTSASQDSDPLPAEQGIIPFIQPPNHTPERKLGHSDGAPPVFDQPSQRMAVPPPTYSECC